jgi:hypothetical protein
MSKAISGVRIEFPADSLSQLEATGGVAPDRLRLLFVCRTLWEGLRGSEPSLHVTLCASSRLNTPDHPLESINDVPVLLGDPINRLRRGELDTKVFFKSDLVVGRQKHCLSAVELEVFTELAKHSLSLQDCKVGSVYILDLLATSLTGNGTPGNQGTLRTLPKLPTLTRSV